MTRRMRTALRLLAALGAFGAPALFAQMVVVQSAEAQTDAQQEAQSQPSGSLPQPGYASTNRPVRYGGVQTYDRYGGGSFHPFVATAVGAPAYVGPRLSWSSKAETPDAGPRYPGLATYAQPAPSRQAVGRGWAPAQTNIAQAMPVQASQEQMAAAGPTRLSSIYDPPPPTAASSYAAPPAPTQTAASDTGSTRRYSVHREFGMEPTPIPIPPQFFGATADLTQPETAEAARRTVTSDGKSHNALQPADGQ